jgi:peroxiredoxin
LKEAEAELLELGYQIIAISPDKGENLKTTKEKHEMNYQLLSDSKMKAAIAFGIAFKVDSETFKKYKSYEIDLESASGEKHHLLPVPAVFLINTEGIILFQYVNPNYKVRLRKEIILAAARAFL